MKKQLPLFVATLATLFVTLTASAQGEWKWAHYSEVRSLTGSHSFL